MEKRCGSASFSQISSPRSDTGCFPLPGVTTIASSISVAVGISDMNVVSSDTDLN